MAALSYDASNNGYYGTEHIFAATPAPHHHVDALAKVEMLLQIRSCRIKDERNPMTFT
jgi:hypothetical protein